MMNHEFTQTPSKTQILNGTYCYCYSPLAKLLAVDRERFKWEQPPNEFKRIGEEVAHAVSWRVDLETVARECYT